jgi:hypothetical protein
MTSTYRDLAGFFAPLAPDAGRLDNSASSGSTLAGGTCAPNADDEGLEGGSPDGVGRLAGGVANGADPVGVGAGGCIVVDGGPAGIGGGATVGIGGVDIAGVFVPGLLGGGGGGGATFAGTPPLWGY